MLEVETIDELIVNDFNQLFTEKFEKFINELSAKMISEIANVRGLPNEWVSSLQSSIDSSVERKDYFFSAEVGLREQSDLRTVYSANIVNYGMGQNSSRRNAYLSEYMSSSSFNKYRSSGMYIYTRSDSYFDVDTGKYVEGSGYTDENGKPLMIEHYGNHHGVFWFENTIDLFGGYDGIVNKINEILSSIIREMEAQKLKYISFRDDGR